MPQKTEHFLQIQNIKNFFTQKNCEIAAKLICKYNIKLPNYELLIFIEFAAKKKPQNISYMQQWTENLLQTHYISWQANTKIHSERVNSSMEEQPLNFKVSEKNSKQFDRIVKKSWFFRICYKNFDSLLISISPQNITSNSYQILKTVNFPQSSTANKILSCKRSSVL